MKRRLLGCLALSLLTATCVAQQPTPGGSAKRAPERGAAVPARLNPTPAVNTQQVPTPAVPTRLPASQPIVATPAQSAPEQTPELPTISPEAMTPGLYLYLQDQKRHDDPSQAVRRKAEFKAAQRMNRMATLKWFGMSNARPQAAAVPMMGVYSPAWIGNGYDRYDWVGGTYPATSVYLELDTVQR